jgi:DNA-binding GntR family transcriptional regulator
MSHENVTLKTFAYDGIKSRIINCDYSPGSWLNEQDLGTDLNISRTPIREALNRLEQEGWIRIISKKGILVSNLSISDLSDIYQLRVEVEPFIVRIAGPNLDHQKLQYFRELFLAEDDQHSLGQLETDTAFHSYLSENSNKYIVSMMKKVLEDNKRVMIATRNKSRVDSARCEHLKVIDLLLAGEYDAAAVEMRIHIENCRDSAIAYLLNGAGV